MSSEEGTLMFEPLENISDIESDRSLQVGSDIELTEISQEEYDLPEGKSQS